MSREIRRVPAGWEHPKDKAGNYQPLYDEDYETVITEWINNHNLWLGGKHPDQIKCPERMKEYKYYAEWSDNPPMIEYYRPRWTDEERTHYQVYETVSEGTPLTPAFATKEELIDYLVEYGTFWNPVGYDRAVAEKFVNSGWVPSGMVANGKFYRGIGCAGYIPQE